MNINDAIILPEQCWTMQKIYDQLDGNVSDLTAEDISETLAYWWAREEVKVGDKVVEALAEFGEDNDVRYDDLMFSVNDKLIELVRSAKARS